jgi:hypothetical protein
MAGLVRFIVVCALCAAVIAGVSWGVALHRVDVLLGDPPPRMGTQKTTFSWDTKMWLFAFGPTKIPGAQNVRIYVTPVGRVVQTEPSDLAARVKVFHATGY